MHKKCTHGSRDADFKKNEPVLLVMKYLHNGYRKRIYFTPQTSLPKQCVVINNA